MRILIADDQSNNLLLLHTLLSPYGVCEMVSDGSEVIDIFETALKENNPYDLICLDIMMPIMNGQETLKKIRSLEKSLSITQKKETIVLMITSLDKEHDVFNAFKGGCTDYIVKPVTQEKLKNKMKEYQLIQ